MNQRISRQLEIRIGTVVQVDTTNHKIVLVDNSQGNIEASMHLWDPLMAIPKIGEIWLLERQGVDWLLDRRLEANNENIPISRLKPGDRRLNANSLYINATPSGVSDTGVLLTYNNGSVVTQRISIGSVDSGGTGFRVLRVPN